MHLDGVALRRRQSLNLGVASSKREHARPLFCLRDLMGRYFVGLRSQQILI